MADLIKIVPERVKEEAGKLRESREEHIDIMDRLGNLVVYLGDVWEGQAYEKFVTTYKEVEKEISKFSDILEKYAEKMDDISSCMLSTDQTLTTKINSL